MFLNVVTSWSCVWLSDVCVLPTLHHQLYQGLSGLDVEAVVLARLAAVRPAHLSGHVADPQDAVVALRLNGAVWHQCRCRCCRHPALLHPRPQDDGFGFSRDQALQVYGVAFLSDEVRAPPGDGELWRNYRDRDRISANCQGLDPSE